ncbi:formyltransferase family protein [Flavobacteriales bacterium]|nr:formyltransferase family protein [Flavobacteriales bacterium]
MTSSMTGTASHHLPILDGLAKNFEVSAVLLVDNHPTHPWRHRRRKLRKLWHIGAFGALNGVRMRSWYDPAHFGDVKVPTLEDAIDLCKASPTLFRSGRTNSEQTKATMRKAELDVCVSLGNGYIAPSVFSIPHFGMLNVHHEMLPAFKNAQSVIWQLHEGSANTGYTIHEISREMDGGRILHQAPIPICFEPTLGKTVNTTYATLWEASATGLAHVLNHFEAHQHNATHQGPGGHFTTPTFSQYLSIHQQWKSLRASSIDC